MADGAYRVHMPDGFQAAGTFLLVDPPHQVAFTWGFADDEAACTCCISRPRQAAPAPCGKRSAGALQWAAHPPRPPSLGRAGCSPMRTAARQRRSSRWSPSPLSSARRTCRPSACMTCGTVPRRFAGGHSAEDDRRPAGAIQRAPATRRHHRPDRAQAGPRRPGQPVPPGSPASVSSRLVPGMRPGTAQAARAAEVLPVS